MSILTEFILAFATWLEIAPTVLISIVDFYVKSSLFVLFALYVQRSASPFINSEQKRILWLSVLIAVSMLPLSIITVQAIRAEWQLVSSLNLLTVVIPSSVQAGTHAIDNPLGVLLTSALVIYFGVLVGYLFKFSLSLNNLRRLNNSAVFDSPNHVRYLLEKLCARSGVKRTVRLGVSHICNSPMTYGILRPTIILPSRAYYSETSLLENVLVHELSHIRRADSLIYMFSYLLAALNWFNPSVWYCLRNLDMESEYACDDDVVREGAQRLEFASQLVAIAKSGLAHCNSAIAARLVLSGGHLTRRVEHILHESYSCSSGRTSSCSTAIVMLSFFLLLASAGKVFSLGDENSFVSEELRLIYSELPEYPEGAFRKGQTGFATFSFRVDEKGNVDESSIELIKSEPRHIFDRPAADSLSSFVFSPRRVNGHNVAAAGVQFTFQFDMKI